MVAPQSQRLIFAHFYKMHQSMRLILVDVYAIKTGMFQLTWFVDF
jgi:hypothetical protein